MKEDAHKQLLGDINDAIGKNDQLWEAMARGRNSRAIQLQNLKIDAEQFKSENRKIKSGSSENSSLVSEFARKVEANGGKVFLAKDGDSAIKYISDICKKGSAKLVVKTKSLTSEEIELNQGLEAAGIKVVETDLGELICQVANEKPSHLVFPAVHKSARQIAELFSKEFGEAISDEPSEILSRVRNRLRPLFLSADVGITGANIGIAQSGSIIIETNEGNGRLVTSLPRIHIVIIGLEKIVRSWSDVPALIGAHAISATGQMMTVYISVITGRVPLCGSLDDREFHVIILDNGRSRMRNDRVFSDALNCIRCGACMNICPTYGVVGGHVFGYIYPGPIGIPWTANVHGLDKAEFADLCIACGLCKEICPVDIDIPLMIANVKARKAEEKGQILVNDFFMSSERLARIASKLAPLSNWLIERRISRYVLEKVVGVDRRRHLPIFAGTRLAKLAEKEGLLSWKEGRKVIYFPDLHADLIDPELGLIAIKLLRKLGFHVLVPPELRWSGMPYVSYGNLKQAVKVALHNLHVIEAVTNGEPYEIISTEPTAIYMLREIYPKLVPSAVQPMAHKVAAASYPYFSFIEGYLPNLVGTLSATEDTSSAIGFHISCHDRLLSTGLPAMKLLQLAGYSPRVIETGTCCGMAGTFGMKHGPLGYSLSMAVGEKLFNEFRKSGCTLIATESSVCATQLLDGLRGVKVMHPLHMLRVQ